ncbi:MAG: helix-turn-helix domain-containing protein [Acidobacteriota bacterium]|nr:helix-turn-helix domain-containing protein [Acidobacteriota bacterium]
MVESEAVMENVCIAFGKRLRTLRKQMGWSQEKLSEKAGMHPTYVGGIERGERNVSLETIEKLAVAFSLPIAEFFDSDRLVPKNPPPATPAKIQPPDKQEWLRTELAALIRQQDDATCEFLLRFLKTPRS